MSYEIESKDKFIIGFWIALIGGAMLTFAGIIGLFDFWILVEISFIFIVPYIVTLFWGILALIGVLLVRFEHEAGDYILILSGTVAMFGMFIPLFALNLESGFFTIYLSYSFAYVDPFLVLIGGILNLIVRKGIIEF